jgi:hypothetical protein
MRSVAGELGHFPPFTVPLQLLIHRGPAGGLVDPRAHKLKLPEPCLDGGPRKIMPSASVYPWSHARHNRTLGHGAAARLALKQPGSDEAETNPSYSRMEVVQSRRWIFLTQGLPNHSAFVPCSMMAFPPFVMGTTLLATPLLVSSWD